MRKVVLQQVVSLWQDAAIVHCPVRLVPDIIGSAHP